MDTVPLQEQLVQLKAQVQEFNNSIKEKIQNANYAELIQINRMFKTVMPQVDKLAEAVKDLE